MNAFGCNRRPVSPREFWPPLIAFSPGCDYSVYNEDGEEFWKARKREWIHRELLSRSGFGCLMFPKSSRARKAGMLILFRSAGYGSMLGK